MEEDCGCDISENIDTKEFISPDTSGIGEEIFEDEDIFDRVKKYYQDFSGEDKKIEEDDFLLDSSPKKKLDSSIEEFTNELKDIINSKPKISDSRSLDALDKPKTFEDSDLKSLGEEVVENVKKLPNIKTSEKERKIKFIKDYLKKLKDGS
tara:strand:+ start:213 stop:665 length:453 start_codon:yes stop_codon:yes gene_type:complete